MQKIQTLGEMEEENPDVFRNPALTPEEQEKADQAFREKSAREKKFYEDHPECLDNSNNDDEDEDSEDS